MAVSPIPASPPLRIEEDGSSGRTVAAEGCPVALSAALPLSLRLARRDLRGALRSFRIFLLCLTLGVAAIAGVGSLSQALLGGLARDARALLAGDIELRLTHREASAEQRAWLAARAAVAPSIDMRAMAQAENGRRSLVELKAVDRLYPLYGRLELAGGGEAGAALARKDGLWGVLVDPALLRRLGLAPGDRLKVGQQTYRIADAIAREPDRGADGFVLGPRLMVALESMAGTGLIREGSLIHYNYNLRLPAGTDVPAFVAEIGRAFPDAGWRVRDVRNGAPGLKRFVDRMQLFLTLVGLTALLVGGLGVGNAVKAYLDGKIATIATLKCVGAPAGLVFRTYLAEVLTLAAVGIAAGLLLGTAVPPLAAGVLSAYLPFEARVGFYPGPLVLAAAFGVLTALAFALWPLGRAREIPAATLFRSAIVPGGLAPRPSVMVATGLAFLALAALAVASADDRRIALWFVLGAAGAVVAFLAAARAVIWTARRLPRPSHPGLRLALANLHRPGAPTVSVLLSFGLGLTVLVAVAGVQGNLVRQVAERIPAEAPAYFFVDIQTDQIDRFREIAFGVPGMQRIEAVPSLRGRIVRVNGEPSERVRPTPESAWALRGDRGLTYQATPPAESPVVAGAWWPPNYAGPPLISLDEEIANGIGVGVGDSLTVNVLGREIEGRIANLRRIDWSSLGINFVLIFAPGALEAAPHSFIATAYVDADAEARLDAAVADAFPNVTAIRVKDALETVNAILGNIGAAVGAIAAVTLLAGVLVLAGAVAAGHRRRVYDAVVLKVLGATRGIVLRAYLMEYALLGLVAAAIALVIGTAAAWGVVTQVMGADWIWLPGSLAAVAGLSLAVTLAVGLAGTLAALGQKAAPLLRNE